MLCLINVKKKTSHKTPKRPNGQSTIIAENISKNTMHFKVKLTCKIPRGGGGEQTGFGWDVLFWPLLQKNTFR